MCYQPKAVAYLSDRNTFKCCLTVISWLPYSPTTYEVHSNLHNLTASSFHSLNLFCPISLYAVDAEIQ